MDPGPPTYDVYTATCYRHPDRRAGVTCQRCDRPICPSCMVSASVGFQCPECAHQGAKQQRLVDVHRAATQPVVTNVLIALNVVVYVVGHVLKTSVQGLPFDVKFSLISGAVAGPGSGGFSDANNEWWRIISGGFLHANLIHIAFNMFALWSVGTALEREVGRVRFSLIYGVSLIGGSLGAILLSSPNTPTVGASGAIFGVFGALVVLQLSRGINPWRGGIMSTIVLNLVLTFAIPGISVGGHLGGLAAGAVAAFVLIGHSVAASTRRERSMPAMVTIVVVVGAVMFAASVLAANYITLHGALVS